MAIESPLIEPEGRISRIRLSRLLCSESFDRAARSIDGLGQLVQQYQATASPRKVRGEHANSRAQGNERYFVLAGRGDNYWSFGNFKLSA